MDQGRDLGVDAELLRGERTAVTAGMLAQTGDVASMAGYLHRSVRHFLVDEARKTPIGAVRRKLEELVAATPEFVQVPAGTPGAGPLAARRRAATALRRRAPSAGRRGVPGAGVQAVRWSFALPPGRWRWRS